MTILNYFHTVFFFFLLDTRKFFLTRITHTMFTERLIEKLRTNMLKHRQRRTSTKKKRKGKLFQTNLESFWSLERMLEREKRVDLMHWKCSVWHRSHVSHNWCAIITWLGDRVSLIKKELLSSYNINYIYISRVCHIKKSLRHEAH